MKKVLLLGAGFSRNWGGPLAKEFFGSLIGSPRVSHDRYLQQTLRKHQEHGGFEEALAEVQAAFSRDPSTYRNSLDALQAEILKLFDRMNRAFSNNTMGVEFQNHKHSLLREFLTRFDAICTLNQDLLLELHYLDHVPLTERRRWDGAHIPGMKPLPLQGFVPGSRFAASTWVPLSVTEFKIEPRSQPFMKLHGSTNWRQADGGPMMIIGGGKGDAILRHAVLSWYFQQFRSYLSDGESKLCVIGYGFRDNHVNEILIDAAQNHGMKFFVVDPNGDQLPRAINPTAGSPIYAPNEVDSLFHLGLDGASQRALNETFGGDEFSLEQLHGYLSNGKN